MKETIQATALNKMAIKLASEALAASQWEALYEETYQEKEGLERELAVVRLVLDSDLALKELFEEAKNKMMEEETYGISH